MNDLRERWTVYGARVIPRDAPPIQMVECRRAYFAGCGAVLDLIDKLDDVGPLERAHSIRLLRAEVEKFRQEVASDRA